MPVKKARGSGRFHWNEWVILKRLYTSGGRQGPIGFRTREELRRFEDLFQMLLRTIGYRLENLTHMMRDRRLPANFRHQGYVIPGRKR